MFKENQILTDFVKRINSFSQKKLPFFFMVDFEMRAPIVWSLDELHEQGIWIDFPNYKNYSPRPLTDVDTKLDVFPGSFSNYKKGYEHVRVNLLHGNSFLCNYTMSTPIQVKTSLANLFFASSSKYKILRDNSFLCFSPETFIEIKNGMISSRPMKGTIDADLPNAAEIILNDPKETAEHYTIVDLIRNDLASVATDVQVKQFRYIDKIQSAHKNLLQVSSLIEGKLPDNYFDHLGDLIIKLLPAGSISGAPKKKTVEIICEAESHQRNYYTGVAGYFDGLHLDTCVMIRFIERTPDGWVYKSGGGITCNSKMETEYNEAIDKIYVPIF